MMSRYLIMLKSSAFRILMHVMLVISVLVISALGSGVAVAREEFSVWLEGLRQEAKAAGISDNTITATINHVALIPGVITLDRSQPEFISPFLDYYYKRVDAGKIQKGRQLIAEHYELLDQIEAQYGVPKSILIAFWGMETQYGGYQGNIDTLSALATLAYDGRRADFFRSQLLDAMRMIEAGHVNLDKFQGSWAGAVGNMQFMPSTFMLYAVDGDADNSIDVVNSLADAFASAANYLSQVGWYSGEPVMLEVQLPEGFDWQNAQLTVKKSVEEWSRLGVRAFDVDSNSLAVASSAALNQDFPRKKIFKEIKGRLKNSKSLLHKVTYQRQQNNQNNSESIVSTISLGSAQLNVNGQAAILLPQGWRGPAFMVFDNFDVIMDWNRSVNYALSVAQLAKRLQNESRIIGGKSAEEGALSFREMFELQSMLNTRGFDTGVPDGLPGLQTQAAVRAYQVMQQLPADGYASPSLYRRLFLQP